MTPRLATRIPLLLAASVLLSAAPSAVPAKQKETAFYSFGVTSADAKYPQDGVIADEAGNMYGTAYQGGLHDLGAVFILGSNGLETPIYSFTGGSNDGAEPNAGLVMDKKGNLYGTTMAGGAANKGVVFELVPNGESYTEKVLYNFCSLSNCSDGDTPAGRVTLGAKGVLFGTTQIGGAGAASANGGTVWRLDPPTRRDPTWKETVLYRFCSQTSCSDGRDPYTSPVLAKDGFLYGTAAISQVGGTLYRVSPNGGGFQILHYFGYTTADGATPISFLAADHDGVLYGTTRQGGGSAGCGTVYSFDPSSFAYNTLYTFCSQPNDGKSSYGGLTIVEKRKTKTLYGNTIYGGTTNNGTIFSLTSPKTAGGPWTEKILYSFCPKTNCTDGSEPAFGNPVNIDGVFYGTTMGGGAYGAGVVYRLGPP